MNLRRLQVAGMMLLAFFAGCQRCGSSSRPLENVDFLQYVPRDAQLVVLVPQIGTLGSKLTVLENLKAANLAAQLNGFATAKEYSSALMGQIGVDLRSSEALEKIGLSGKSALAFAVTKDGDRSLAFVQVKAEKPFLEFVKTMANSRMGAASVNEKKIGGYTLVSYARASGELVLSLAISEQVAVLGFSSKSVEPKAVFSLASEKSLKQDTRFQAALKNLPEKFDAFLFEPTHSGRSALMGKGGTGVAIQLTEKEFIWVFDVPEKLNARNSTDSKTQLLNGRSLPEDAFLVSSFQVQPSDLDVLLQGAEGERLSKAFAEAKVDLKEEVVSNLESEVVAAVSLAPSIRFDRGMPNVDPRRSNPFRFVQLWIAATTKDAAKAASTLEKLPAVGAEIGARIERQEEGGVVRYKTVYAQGDGIHFGMKDRHVIATSSLPWLEEFQKTGALQTKRQAASNPASSRSEWQQGSLSVQIDLKRLSQSVKELPDEVWGIGGFAIKATTLRWLEATDDLRAITFNMIPGKETSRMELSLKMGQP